LLVIPEAEKFRCRRHFCQYRLWLRVFFPIADMLDDGALAQSSELLDDKLRQRKALRPKGVELLLQPSDALWVIIFPHKLIIFGPGIGAVIGTAYEGGGTPRPLDDTPLAMNEAEVGIRHYTQFE